MAVTLEADGAIQLMDGMAERSQDLSAVMRVIASDMLTFVDTTFAASISPTGHEWEPLSEFTISLRRDRKKRPISSDKPLIDSGILRNSITAVPGVLAVIVGTNVPYAGHHQFGTFKIPARPFFPLTEDGEVMDEGPIAGEWERYEEMIATYIETGDILEG